MKPVGRKTVGFEITVPLTEQEAKDLKDRVKCAVALVLPQRIQCGQMKVQPKVSAKVPTPK